MSHPHLLGIVRRARRTALGMIRIKVNVGLGKYFYVVASRRAMEQFLHGHGDEWKQLEGAYVSLHLHGVRPGKKEKEGRDDSGRH